MHLATWTVAPSRPANNIIGMIGRRSITPLEFRHTVRVGHQGVIPPSPLGPMACNSNHNMESFTHNDSVVHCHLCLNLFGATASQ